MEALGMHKWTVLTLERRTRRMPLCISFPPSPLPISTAAPIPTSPMRSRPTLNQEPFAFRGGNTGARSQYSQCKQAEITVYGGFNNCIAMSDSGMLYQKPSNVILNNPSRFPSQKAFKPCSRHRRYRSSGSVRSTGGRAWRP